MLSVPTCSADESGGTKLKIGTPNTIKSASILGDTNMGVFSHLSNPTLTKMAADGTIVGLTAKSYQVSEDGKTWRFLIDDNLYWSDGTKVTPDDVKFTFDYLAQKYPAAGWMKTTINGISVDGNTVVFKLNKPYSRLNLEFATYPILPKHIWEKIDKPMEYTNESAIVGFGPFVISKTDMGSNAIYLKKNPYWKGTTPKVDSIELDLYSSPSALALALDKGSIDAYYKYAGTYPYTSIQKLKSSGKFDFVETDNIGLIFLGMNLKNAPMSDLNFRNAVSYAINYSEILKVDALGYGSIPNRGFVPSAMSNFKATGPLEYNLTKAKELLADAGYQLSDGTLKSPDGKDIKLTLLTRSDYQRVSELLRDYLKAIGVNAEIKMVDSSTWIKQKDAGQYDLTVTRSTPWGMLMHANWGTGYFDSRRTGEGVLHVVDDPKFQKLCDDILTATTDDQLKDYACQVQDYYAENLPGIALYWNKVFTPYNKAFTGWYSDPLYGIYNVDNFLNVQRTG
ncbi:MAG: ABC transporter substrate-binding protein [Methanotrichaceae archaeon]